MTNSKDNFQLIKGTFETEDAKEVLVHIFQEKIRFHCNRSLSLYERFGETDEYSEGRVEELRSDKAEILKLIETAKLTGKNLRINCQINLELTDDVPTLKKGKEVGATV